MGSTISDDRTHLENGSDWAVTDLTLRQWISADGNYSDFYDNGTMDPEKNVTISLVRWISDSTPYFFIRRNYNSEMGMLNYSTSGLLANSKLAYLFVFTLGDFMSIDQWILTVEHNELPVPNFMTRPAISWNQSKLELGPVTAGSSESKNVTLQLVGWHDNINITIVSGNATDSLGDYFISVNPTLVDLANGEIQVSVTCSPPATQINGYYEVTVNARSKRNPIGDNLTVGCQVGEVIASLEWNQTQLDLGSVYQGRESTGVVKAVPYETNTNVILEQLGGNATFILPNVTYINSLSSSQNVEFTCKPYPWTEPGNYSAIWNIRSDQQPSGDNLTVFCEVKRARQIAVVYTDGTWDTYPFNLDDWLLGTGDIQSAFPYSCDTSSGTAYIYYYNITVNPGKIVDKIVFSDNSTSELQQITAITLEKTPGTY